MAVNGLFEFLAREFKSKSILVIDDDDCLKQVMDVIVKAIDERLEITWEKDLTSAKAALKKGRPALIIADFLLKDQETGFEVWKYCQKEYPEIPFMLISSVDLSTLQGYFGTKEPVPPFLRKPFYLTDCKELVRNLISK